MLRDIGLLELSDFDHRTGPQMDEMRRRLGAATSPHFFWTLQGGSRPDVTIRRRSEFDEGAYFINDQELPELRSSQFSEPPYIATWSLTMHQQA